MPTCTSHSNFNARICEHGYRAQELFKTLIFNTPSVADLQRLVNMREANLLSLELTINTKTSFCLRIGPPSNASCNNIVNYDGSVLQWMDSVRCLGSFHHAIIHL